MKHKTMQQLRDNLKKVLKRGRPKQLKKLRKAYNGKRLKKWWSSYANWECCTIEELKDAEHVGHRMKGGHTHNHIYNVCHRITFRSKSARHRVSREDKKLFTATFYTSLKHNLATLDDFLKRRK